MIEVLGYIGLGLIPAFILLDAFRGSRRYAKQRFWRTRATIVTVAAVWLSIQVATGWAWLLGDYSLFDLSRLGTAWGAVVGILVYEFVHYWYHRAIHRFDVLWRLAHQMHHSAERIDAFGAYYLHPVDVFFFTTWGSLVFVPLLGLGAEAAAIGAVFLTFNAMFQHANIRTPHWLGYVIQRPESHCVHHGRGVHHYNYSDLPLWDMLFGTFLNPKHVDDMEAGFYDGASERLAEVLAFRDVSVPPANTDDTATAPATQA
ncbi:MAG: sterol desaturase family protein [Woeseiaceae bacterium]|nr:sterol desaturase family protein [Woeseiaceae bacterium]